MHLIIDLLHLETDGFIRTTQYALTVLQAVIGLE